MRSRPRWTMPTSTASSRCCGATRRGRSSSSSPTRSARWRRPTGFTESRWAVTASRRCSRDGCPLKNRQHPRSPRSHELGAATVARPVARDWSELFITEGGEAASQSSASAAERQSDGEPGASQSSPSRRGLFRRLRESMAKTRQALGSEIQATLFGVLDEHTWERLEEALIMADVGAATTASVVGTLEAEAAGGGLEGGAALSERLIELLAETARAGDGRIDIRPRPTVIIAVGVNGTGKTTT